MQLIRRAPWAAGHNSPGRTRVHSSGIHLATSQLPSIAAPSRCRVPRVRRRHRRPCCAATAQGSGMFQAAGNAGWVHHASLEGPKVQAVAWDALEERLWSVTESVGGSSCRCSGRRSQVECHPTSQGRLQSHSWPDGGLLCRVKAHALGNVLLTPVIECVELVWWLGSISARPSRGLLPVFRITGAS